MNQRQNIFQKLQDINFYRLNFLFLLATILIILIATLYPFKFSFPDGFSVNVFLASFNNASSFQDQVNNVLLFMPLGFYTANFWQRLRVRLILQIMIVLLLSAGLSLTVETLQVFLPSRSPTPADIFNNTWGGCLGFLCFYFWNYQKLNNTIPKIKSSSLRLANLNNVGLMIGYFSFILMMSLLWQSTTNLSNWDLNYPLVLGNELTGNRNWQGYISQVYITDTALSNSQAKQGLKDPNFFANLGNSLLANYQLSGKCCYQDKTGNLPELLWQGKAIKTEVNQGVFFSSNQWLKTPTSVQKLSQRISQTSEFTLSAILATDNIQQTGYARIISISENSLRRNLTISQQGDSLELRLRTPLTGENGSDIQLMIPNVFKNKEFHQIIITYSRGRIKFYIDKLQQSYSINLLELIPFNQKLFYYGLIFMPLGASLAILRFRFFVENNVRLSKRIIVSGILLPSIILEAILMTGNYKSLSWKNLCLGILFTAVTMLIFTIRAKYLESD